MYKYLHMYLYKYPDCRISSDFKYVLVRVYMYLCMYLYLAYLYLHEYKDVFSTKKRYLKWFKLLGRGRTWVETILLMNEELTRSSY